MNYSFSPKFGFLTADPSVCGTAFVLTIYIQPSALIHLNSLEKTFERIKNPAISITGIQGEKGAFIGDVVAVRNNYTLGVADENIISTLRLFATKLLVEENSFRTQLRREDRPELKDKVSRAFGVLIHSYQIEAVEALNAISLLKLGADLGWLIGASAMELNRLFFNCRRAHLLSQYEEEVSQEELSHKRAEFIHKTLKKVSLTI
jgi:protein arginine kinase